jgi:hypothetical protein
MTPDEAQQLLAACAAFDNRQPSQIAKRAWASALKKIPLDDDCFEAVARYYATPAKDGARLWIQPADVVTHRRAVRAERLENFVYEPPPGLDDPDYIKRLRGQQYAVGSGTMPAPSRAPALTGGPTKQVAEYLAGVGRDIPVEDDDEVAAVRRPGPLGVECPKCTAPIGRPCRTPRGKERATHPARLGEATDPQAEQAEIEQRRAASAAVLRRLEAGEAL